MSARTLRFWTMLLVALGCVAFAATSEAHPSPTSVAFVDFTVDGARIEQTVPLAELEAALHRGVVREGETARQSVTREASFLRDYVGAHVRLSHANADAWHVTSLDLDGRDAAEGPELHFVLTLRAPTAASGTKERLWLVDDVVAHEVVTHYLSVYVRSDWEAGLTAPTEPQLLGTVHGGKLAIEIPRKGSFFRGFRSVIAQGIEHITSGTDHLVFLFSLLLVAPAIAARGRWIAVRTTREAVGALLRVVTAFTIGHSLTLTLGVVGLVVVPPALVEALIAASIVVTAMHAQRPLFPRREALVAAAFGLVHGLAFATTLAGRELGRTQTTCTILAFNLGIELAQIALLAFVVPWLLVLSKTSIYGRFRSALAFAAGMLALGWLAERSLGVRSPTSAMASWLEAHPLGVLVSVAATACAGRLYDTLRAIPARLPSDDAQST